jgi:hypothetical protein
MLATVPRYDLSLSTINGPTVVAIEGERKLEVGSEVWVEGRRSRVEGFDEESVCQSCGAWPSLPEPVVEIPKPICKNVPRGTAGPRQAREPSSLDSFLLPVGRELARARDAGLRPCINDEPDLAAGLEVEAVEFETAAS